MIEYPIYVICCNESILNTYKDKHTQISIATYLNLSISLVSKIVKGGYSITGI